MDPTPPDTPTPVSLRRTELHTLPSRHVGRSFQLRVAHPVPGFRGGPAPKPRGVLYLLDGDLYFGTATESTRLLNQFMEELPPLLVVGIGYGGDDPALHAELRARDYTPTAPPAWEALTRTLSPGRAPSLPEGARTGGAEAFLDFLEGELRPFVARRWPVPEGDAVLFGSSLGGLLAAWGLLTRPGLMDGWILTSPSLWWDDGVVLAREREGAEAGTKLRGRVHLTAGSLEEGTGIPALDRYRLVSNTRLLAERLAARGDPGLDVTVEVVAGETHTSVVPTALIRGLRALHPRRPGPGGP